MCDSRGAWLLWCQTGPGGGRSAACLHEPATVSVCFGEEKCSVTYFVSFCQFNRQVFHSGDIHKSISEWKQQLTLLQAYLCGLL